MRQIAVVSHEGLGGLEPARQHPVIDRTPVERQKELFEELQESMGKDSKHAPRQSTWFEGVKNFFEDMKL